MGTRGTAKAKGMGARQRPASLRRVFDSVVFSTMLLCTGILGGCAGLVNGTKTTTGQAAFRVSPTSVNFGKVGVGKQTTQTVAVTNTGTMALSITQATVSNLQFGWTGVTLPMSIATGQSANFTVVVNPTATGTLSGTLTVHGSDGAAPGVVNLSATAVASAPQISLSSSSVQFGTVGVGSTGTMNLTISNTGSADLTISAISATGAEFGVSGITTPKTIVAGQSALVGLSFQPKAGGAAAGTLSITSNDPANPTMTVALGGTGSTAAFGQLQANPTSVSFGSVSTGSSATQHILLTNTGTTAVQISSIAATGSGFSVNGITTPITVNAAASATLNVVFAPTAGGSASGSVTVTSNGNNSPLSVPVTGTGIAATISLTPSSANFGSVTLGSTNSQTIRISNPGNGVLLTITQANVTGSGFSTAGLTLPLSINPGQSSTFNAQYQPSVAGSASGSITIVSNAATSPSVVALTGTGVAATHILSLSTNTVSFGNVDNGTTSTQTVTVTNTGNSNVQISQITASGAAYSLSGASAPVTLTPSQRLTFGVIFSPTVAGSASGSVMITSNATGSPSTISLSGSGVVSVPHTVSLSWTASTSVVSGYNVYRSTTSGGGYTKLTNTLDASVSYTDSTVVNGTTYYYVTTAVDGSGNESYYSNEATAVIP